MPDTYAFPSDGLSQALDGATWAKVQNYIGKAEQIPTSPTPSVETILKSLQSAATTASTGPVAQAQSCGNTVYNGAMTIVQSLQAIRQLLSAGSATPDLLRQLLKQLENTATEMTTDFSQAGAGMETFVTTTTKAGHQLTQATTELSDKVGAANTSIAKYSGQLTQDLAAEPLDAGAIGAAMAGLTAGADKLSGVSFVGLGFDNSDGVAAGTDAASQFGTGAKAAQTLVTSIKALEAKVAQTPADKLASLPEFSETVLAAQSNAWKAVGDHAHSFMMNFSVTAA